MGKSEEEVDNGNESGVDAESDDEEEFNGLEHGWEGQDTVVDEWEGWHAGVDAEKHSGSEEVEEIAVDEDDGVEAEVVADVAVGDDDESDVDVDEVRYESEEEEQASTIDSLVESGTQVTSIGEHKDGGTVGLGIRGVATHLTPESDDLNSDRFDDPPLEDTTLGRLEIELGAVMDGTNESVTQKQDNETAHDIIHDAAHTKDGIEAKQAREFSQTRSMTDMSDDDDYDDNGGNAIGRRNAFANAVQAPLTWTQDRGWLVGVVLAAYLAGQQYS